MKKLPQLFENNRKWSAEALSQDPHYFDRCAQGQTPKYLWIGCSDSRVPANQIVGLEAGELFVHRNIANICHHTDLNFLSVVEYAVIKLGVEHIIVCGHYDCGGILAALETEELGLADNWLRVVRDIHFKYSDELDRLSPEEKKRRLVELNIIEQVKNVCHTTIVQKAWKKSQPLCIHGWAYDHSTGILHDLNTTFSKLKDIEERYRIS